MTRPLIAAHRGASKAEKENTLDAFRAAGRLGADMVELDVRRTSDSRLVVHHDPKIGMKAIVRMRAEDLPAYVPSLADALDACDGMQVNIEIKNDGSEPDYDPRHSVADAVVALLRERGDGERMLISSFDRDTIDRVHALETHLRTGFLFMDVFPDAARMMHELAHGGHVAVHPYRKVVNAALVQAAHANGLQVNGWDIGIRSYFGRIASARTHSQSQVPLLNCYRAGDGKAFWLIGLEGDRHWPGLVAALGRPELQDDERFRSGTGRKKNSEALIVLLDELFASATRDEWTARFDEHDVWWSPVNSIADVLEDPQAEAAGAWVDMPRDPADPAAGSYRASASPVSFSNYAQVPGAVHAVGQDTDAILGSLA